MDREDLELVLSRLDKETTTKISLSNKEVDEIPDIISEFKLLKHLDLSYNNLKVFPSVLFQLPQLESLLIFRNNIKEIPEGIQYLNKLNVLDISYNPIESIPKEIGELVHLKTLDLSHCNITVLPLEVTRLLGLKDLYLDVNPLEFPPLKIAQKGVYATMHFLAQEKRRLESSKVLLQVYNFPDDLQRPFRQYIECFKDVISNASQYEFNFEIRYINQYLQQNFELPMDVEHYIYEFLTFIKQNAHSLGAESLKQVKSTVFDAQIVDLKNEIQSLNESLRIKIQDLSILQEKIQKLTNSMDKQ